MTRVGTRGSKLAIWQADEVQAALTTHGHSSSREVISTFGDQNQQKPVYQYGIQGVFTKALDIALINDEVDIAVHSLKDVPTTLADGLVLAGVLPRGPIGDVVIKASPETVFSQDSPQTIATSSIRRSSNWLKQYPAHTIVPVRGNIQTRLRKLQEHNWDGMILAEAAVKRLNIWDEETMELLSWMLPAPSQGIVGIVCREEDSETRDIINSLSDSLTMEQAMAERAFLQEIGAGCSAPIGTYASREGETFRLSAEMTSPDGLIHLRQSWETTYVEANLVKQWARELLDAGASTIIEQVKRSQDAS